MRVQIISSPELENNKYLLKDFYNVPYEFQAIALNIYDAKQGRIMPIISKQFLFIR